MRGQADKLLNPQDTCRETTELKDTIGVVFQTTKRSEQSYNNKYNRQIHHLSPKYTV